MEKIVTAGMRNTTIELDGTECAVKFSDNYRCFEVMNDSGGDVTMSIYKGKQAGEDGTLTVHSGTSATLAHMRTDIDTVYITGSGTVQVAAKNTADSVFKIRSRGGDNIPVLPDYIQNGLVARWDWDNSDIETVSGTNYGTSNAVYVYDDESGRYVGNVVKGESVFYRTDLPLINMPTYNNFTLQCLVKVKSGFVFNSNPGIFGIGRNWTGALCQLGVYTDGLLAVERGNGHISSDFYFDWDKWYFIAGVYSNGAVLMYVNGAPVGMGGYSFDISSGNLTIGAFLGSSSNGFDQHIANCCIYNRALTADEIVANYNVDRNRYGIGG